MDGAKAIYRNLANCIKQLGSRASQSSRNTSMNKCGATESADLGGSSKYSSGKLEG